MCARRRVYITDAWTIRPWASGRLPSRPQAPVPVSVIATPNAKSAPARSASSSTGMWSCVNASSWSRGAITSPRASSTSRLTAEVPATCQNELARDG